MPKITDGLNTLPFVGKRVRGVWGAGFPDWRGTITSTQIVQNPGGFGSFTRVSVQWDPQYDTRNASQNYTLRRRDNPGDRSPIGVWLEEEMPKRHDPEPVPPEQPANWPLANELRAKLQEVLGTDGAVYRDVMAILDKHRPETPETMSEDRRDARRWRTLVRYGKIRGNHGYVLAAIDAHTPIETLLRVVDELGGEL